MTVAAYPQAMEATGPDPADTAAAFRAAMRRVASTVHVVTIRVGDTPMGMTATAVSSLALTPPSLLVCVNQSARMHSPMADVRRFCVNVLGSGQMDVARAFSDGRLRDVRFRTGDWRVDGEAPPRLADAQASIVCTLKELHAFGTHSIFVGEVEEVVTREAVDPLVYLDGRYLAAGAPLDG